MTHLLILLIYLFHYGRAHLTLQSIPLMVRSPSLTCWGLPRPLDIDQAITILPITMTCDQSDWGITLNEACYLLDRHNTKLTAFQSLSLRVLVRVDNNTYPLVGVDPGDIFINNTAISPSQTKITAEVGSMQINLTFLNPIEVRTRVTRRCQIKPRNHWMVWLILYRCIRISAQVSELEVVVVPTPLYLKIVAVWSSSTTYGLAPCDNVTCFEVQLESQIPTPQTLCFGMKNVSDSGTICNLSLIMHHW